MARQPRSVTYLVSGDEDIRPSHEVLRKTNRLVRYDAEVHEDAAVELKAGHGFVVVAHGSASGTVTWFNSIKNSESNWLWVGMPTPPRGSHIYVYACNAGKKLAQFLVNCEVLGHVDVVPMPLGNLEPAVTSFLDKVDSLLRDPSLNPQNWADELARFVNNSLAEKGLNPDSAWEDVATMLLLRRSMGYADT